MAQNDGRDEVKSSGDLAPPTVSGVQIEQPAKGGAASQHKESSSDHAGKPRWTRFEKGIFIVQLLTLGSLIAYTVFSGLMWREMRSSNESSDKVAASALKVAEASANVAKATSDWATASGRALREQNRLAGSAVAEARKQSASATKQAESVTKQADAAAQAIEEGRAQAEASRKVLEQSVAIADKTLRESRRSRIEVVSFENLINLSPGPVHTTVKFKNVGLTEAQYSISGEVQVVTPKGASPFVSPQYSNIYSGGSSEGVILIGQTLAINIDRGNVSEREGPHLFTVREKPITAEESESLLTGGATTLYIVGAIRYGDSLGGMHKLRFCAQADHQQHGLLDSRHRRRLVPCSDNNTQEY